MHLCELEPRHHVALLAERGCARLFGARFSRGPLTSPRQRRRERAGQLEENAMRNEMEMQQEQDMSNRMEMDRQNALAEMEYRQLVTEL